VTMQDRTLAPPGATGPWAGIAPSRSGWVVVALLQNRKLETHVEPTFSGAIALVTDASLVLAQVPIGLREEGEEERSCDPPARRAIGRPSSVFPVPCRRALYEPDYDKASALNQRLTGRKLATQTWSLAQRIREVDQYLTQRTPGKPSVREMHSEVAFWALNHQKPLRYNQRSREGAAERAAILLRHMRESEAPLRRLRDGPVPYVKWVIAIAAAFTASAGPDALRTFPDAPDLDAKGLPMEMVFWAGRGETWPQQAGVAE
jgi:predicted RNase H-like nuclease